MGISAAQASTPVSGRVLRTFEQSARLSYERFWIDSARKRWEGEPSWADRDIIGEAALDGMSHGPVLLWDEVLGNRDRISEFVADYFEGNLAVWSPAAEVLERDASKAVPLSDGEFWPFIDLLEGRHWEKTINSAAGRLALEEEDFILRWAETCARKALSIIEAARSDRELAHSHHALHELGAVIGMGKSFYEGVLADASSYVSRFSDHSAQVLWLASRALARKLNRPIQIATSFTPEHHRLLEETQAARESFKQEFMERPGIGSKEVTELLGPDPSLEDINELIAIQQLSAEGLDAVMSLILPTGSGRLSKRVSMRAARALVDDGEDIRIRIIFAAVNDLPESTLLSTLGGAIESFGGQLCSKVEAGDRLFAGLNNTDVFVIKRYFRGTRDEYLRRYVSPRQAEPL